MILLLLTVVLLLVVLHGRFRTTTGRLTRAGVLIAAVAAGVNAGVSYRQENQASPFAGRIYCEYPLQSTGNPRSCYDPRDPVQFARHLKECKIVPGAPPAVENAPSADSRSVPCDYFDQFENRPQRAAPTTAAR